MADSIPGETSGSIHDLFGDWDLAGDLESSSALEDSLRPQSRQPVPGPGPAAGDAFAGRGVPRPGSVDETGLADAFTLGPGEEGSDLDAAVNRRAPRPMGPTGAHPPPRPTESAGAPPLVMPQPDVVLDGFSIVGELGRGAFARVYLARQENLGKRLVALKVSSAGGTSRRTWPGSSTRTSSRSTRFTTTPGPGSG